MKVDSPKFQRSAPAGRATMATPPVNRRPLARRLAIWAGILLVGGYLVVVTASFLWLRYGRKFEQVGFTQVAFFQLKEIRREIAAQQFVQAQAEWDAKNLQSAYVFFMSAVRRDPDNIKGRLEAARFLSAQGATGMVINLLEEGLVRAPDDRELNEMLFQLLIATGRNRHVLELLHGKFAPALTGPNGTFLQACELEATLAVNGGPAARLVLERHPALRINHHAQFVVARVLWAAEERPAALAMLSSFLQEEPTSFPAYVQLSAWQIEAGEGAAAVQTALNACRQFPKEPAARVLFLEAASTRMLGTPEWQRELAIYLRDFGGRPDAIVRLADLAGRKGWVELAHTLFEVGAVRQTDLGLLALFYADALARQSRLPEFRAILEQLDAQAPGGNTAFLLQLRHRQLIAAGMAGDADNVREYARRLATLLRNDPDALEQHRQRYLALGLPDAAAQFAPAAVKAKPTAKPAS